MLHFIISFLFSKTGDIDLAAIDDFSSREVCNSFFYLKRSFFEIFIIGHCKTVTLEKYEILPKSSHTIQTFLQTFCELTFKLQKRSTFSSELFIR